MKVAIIIEKDRGTQKQLQQTLLQLDPSRAFIELEDMADFSNWLAEIVGLLKLKAKADQSFANHLTHPDLPPRWRCDLWTQDLTIDLVFCFAESINNPLISLLQRVEKFLERHRLNPEGQKVPFIFLSYDSPQLGLSPFFSPFVFNVLLKPLDPFLLREVVRLALEKPGPIAPEVYNQQTKSVMEIVKTVRILKITELGFRTLTKRVIPQGQKARYYDKFFGESASLFAYCYNCEESQTEPAAYECSFSFFGPSSEQIQFIRRNIQKSKVKEKLVLPSAPAFRDRPQNVLILSADADVQESMGKILKERFANLNLIPLPSYSRLLSFLAPQKRKSLGHDSSFAGLFFGEDSVIVTLDGSLQQTQKIELKNKGTLVEEDHFCGFPVRDILQQKSFWADLFGKGQIERWQKSLLAFSPNQPEVFRIQLPGQEPSFVQLTEVRQVKVQLAKELSAKAEPSSSNQPEAANPNPVAAAEMADEELITYEVTLTELKGEPHFMHLMHELPALEFIDAVFLDQEYFNLEGLTQIKKALALISESPFRLYALSPKPMSAYQDLEWSKTFDDFFCLPLDVFYFVRKMKQHLPHWSSTADEPLARDAVVDQHVIKTGLPIEVIALSEVHISFRYHRAIPEGEIREFALFGPGFEDSPGIYGKSHFSEKVQGQALYVNHFRFFALGDRHLKPLRRWLKEVYVESKSQEA